MTQLRPNAQEQARRQAEPPLVLILPGSRSSEISRLLAIFGATAARLAKRDGGIEWVLPTLPHLVPRVRQEVAGWPRQPRIVVEQDEKWAAFRNARAALSASGTVTLELALAAVPTVAAYRISLIEEVIARTLIRVHTVILANLVIGENVIPEFLQRDCTPDKLADAMQPLLADTPQRRRQIEAFGRLDSIMAIGTAAPSNHAASVVLDVARRGRRDAVALKRTAGYAAH